MAEPVERDNVINLMDALKKSLKHKDAPANTNRRARKAR